jgi:hypothetical protein
MVPLKPSKPEALEAGWFLENEYPLTEVWDPAVNFDIGRLYNRARTRRFDFYQRSDDAFRIITDGTEIHDIWRRD